MKLQRQVENKKPQEICASLKSITIGGSNTVSSCRLFMRHVYRSELYSHDGRNDVEQPVPLSF